MSSKFSSYPMNCLYIHTKIGDISIYPEEALSFNNHPIRVQFSSMSCIYTIKCCIHEIFPTKLEFELVICGYYLVCNSTARGMQVKNEKFIGERGGYHGRYTLSRPGTCNGTSGFADIHRRPCTAPFPVTTSRYLQSFIPKREANRHCQNGCERIG